MTGDDAAWVFKPGMHAAGATMEERKCLTVTGARSSGPNTTSLMDAVNLRYGKRLHSDPSMRVDQVLCISVFGHVDLAWRQDVPCLWAGKAFSLSLRS